MSRRLTFRQLWAGYGAALWALAFAFLHVAWAADWYIALPAEARWAFSRPWFRVYNLIVSGACLLAIPVALALVQPWGQRLPRWLPNILAWTGTSLLVLRAGGSALQIAYLALAGRYVPKPMHLYEAWFWLGAILFSAALWRFRRAGRGS